MIVKGDRQAILGAGYSGLRGFLKPLADRRFLVEHAVQILNDLDEAMDRIRETQP